MRSDEVMRSLQQQMCFVSARWTIRLHARLRERLGIRRRRRRALLPCDPADGLRPVVEALGAAVGRHAGEGLAPGDRREALRHRPRSAQALNALLHEHFAEEQIFRIDHYLGKETVQNLLALRFANGMFEPIWNRRYIEQVQITAAETVGRAARRLLREGGAARDMVQNHLMQLLSLVMEPPTEFNAGGVRSEDGRAVRYPARSGQRGHPAGQGPVSGRMGERCRGARVSIRARRGTDSSTETFVALRFNLDSWRWAGVPFYLRTGKRSSAE